MFCVRAFARRSLQLSLQSLRSSRIRCAVCSGTPRGQRPKNGRCLFPVPNSTRAATKNGWCLFPAAPDTPARRVIRIIRIIRSYGHTAAWPSLHHTQGRNSDFAFLPGKPITGPAPKVCQRCDPRRTADSVFFSPFTRPAVSPGVCAGLLHSILAWAQDCPKNAGPAPKVRK